MQLYESVGWKLLEFKEQPLFYKRYIDDGFGLWTNGLDSLKEFSDVANSINQNIKIELRHSTEKIEFLDTWVVLEDNIIYTKLYRKPTDKQLYLQKSSSHPPCTKAGLAYGLALRIKRLCEHEEDYLINRKELKHQLRQRGYSGKYIERQLARVDKLEREDVLKKQVKRQNMERVPLVLTFSKHLPNIHSILRKHMNVLHRFEAMANIFQSPPIVSYRRDHNLCDTLVHGKTNKATKGPPKQCSCRTCSYIHQQDILTVGGEKTYRTVPNAVCTDRNLVYALVCVKCKVTVYVGETERSLKERFEEHLRDIRKQSENPIMKHFTNHLQSDVRVAVLQRVYNEERTYRQLIEEEWIKKLDTKVPIGCNVKLNM